MAKYPIKQSLKNISEIISKVGLGTAFTRNMSDTTVIRICMFVVWRAIVELYCFCFLLGASTSYRSRVLHGMSCVCRKSFNYVFHLFPASKPDWQWPEGESVVLQQPEGQPAELREEECVSDLHVPNRTLSQSSGAVKIAQITFEYLL